MRHSRRRGKLQRFKGDGVPCRVGIAVGRVEFQSEPVLQQLINRVGRAHIAAAVKEDRFARGSDCGSLLRKAVGRKPAAQEQARFAEGDAACGRLGLAILLRYRKGPSRDLFEEQIQLVRRILQLGGRILRK